MLSDLERQQLGLAQLKQIRRKYFSDRSEAADWWDKLTESGAAWFSMLRP
jgi:hypothetical protein